MRKKNSRSGREVELGFYGGYKKNGERERDDDERQWVVMRDECEVLYRVEVRRGIRELSFWEWPHFAGDYVCLRF